jgi:hypothetical protein
MTREELREHCHKTLTWYKDQPERKIYQEHLFILSLLNKTEWISVSERLPEEEMNCLVTDSLENVHEVTFYPALDGRESYFSGCYCVRAWMPLPEAYKKSEVER